MRSSWEPKVVVRLVNEVTRRMGNATATRRQRVFGHYCSCVECVLLQVFWSDALGDV